MTRREFASAEYHELVTGLCEQLGTPGLDPAAKEEILAQLENVLTQRMKFIKARMAGSLVPGQYGFQRPPAAMTLGKGA